ncbi:hypothetical protein FACS189418_7930 [Clostridia bacterium]|nr:hypothetical protein FACS189418_7930 [Clostridia bacterium]
MDHFYLVTNRSKDENFAISEQILSYIRKKGKKCDWNEGRRKLSPEIVPKTVEGILTLGGDGTLIQAARDIVSLDIPLLGINFGTLGYLAEVGKDELFSSLDALMQGQYNLESRMMLQGKIWRDEKVIQEDIALNDIVLSRDGSAKIIRFSVYVNNEFLHHYVADGMICATPTGSTAYNLSAGGPILLPESLLMVLTPICAHALHARSSIVLNADDTLSLRVGEKEKDDAQNVIFDGDDAVNLRAGDCLTISRAHKMVKTIKLHDLSLLQTLSKKMLDR